LARNKNAWAIKPRLFVIEHAPSENKELLQGLIVPEEYLFDPLSKGYCN
jgi:hypothetical protein